MNHPVIFQSGHNTLSRQLFVKLILSSESFFGTKKKKRNWQKREYRKIDNNNISSFETKKYSLSLSLSPFLSLLLPFQIKSQDQGQNCEGGSEDPGLIASNMAIPERLFVRGGSLMEGGPSWFQSAWPPISVLPCTWFGRYGFVTPANR